MSFFRLFGPALKTSDPLACFPDYPYPGITYPVTFPDAWTTTFTNLSVEKAKVVEPTYDKEAKLSSWEFDLPGIAKEDVEITFPFNTEMHIKAKTGNREYNYIGIFYGDKETTEATLDLGVLKVTMKDKVPTDRKIVVK